MSFKDLQVEYLEKLRVSGYSARTLKHVKRSTLELIDYFEKENIQEPGAITRLLIREYAAHLKTRPISGVYVANKYTDCRRFLNYLHEEGWTKEDFALVFGRVRKIKPLKTVLMQQEVADLLMQPDITTPRGIRDRALLELFYSSGLRREEVVKIELYDLNMQAGTVKVTGKGNKQRIVPVGRFALYWIHKYIKEVRGVARDQKLFVGMQTRRGLSVEYLGSLIKSCGQRSGIKKKITPHALRHACATHMMQNGAPSTMVQAFLGHEHLITTQIYTHVLTEDLHAVLDRYHPRRWMHVLGSMNPPAL
jgi:site-specific recombinase XerD